MVAKDFLKCCFLKEVTCISLKFNCLNFQGFCNNYIVRINKTLIHKAIHKIITKTCHT